MKRLKEGARGPHEKNPPDFKVGGEQGLELRDRYQSFSMERLKKISGLLSSI
ncbi:MAG: hypothetical protein KAW16_07535 [candidate division Zixibacteria bacterium]|nr:hypothetical protein [candidate division Zixibacteria bacterium]